MVNGSEGKAFKLLSPFMDLRKRQGVGTSVLIK